MTGVVSVRAGAVVDLPGAGQFFVRRFLSATRVQLEHTETAELRTALLSDLESSAPRSEANHLDLAEVDAPRWEAAREKLRHVKRAMDGGAGKELVKEVATQAGVHMSTLYRWMSDYRKGQLLTNLYRKTRSDAGQVRLPVKVEVIIRRAIRDEYLRKERVSPTIAYRQVKSRCKMRGLKVPSLDTFRSRLASCEQKSVASARGEKVREKSLTLNQGTIAGATFPYAVVQIDHTLVDIELVDEVHRIAIGRPWITVAIDVYSRMAVGYYLSFDPPGTLGTGLCLSHAILDKQPWMQRVGVEYDYPCMGVPGITHCDNAKEFRGNTLAQACEQYGSSLQFRKLKRPQHGAHIERLMGTLMAEIHALRGTTFANSKEKGDYDSAAQASMTLKEFERWFAHLVLGHYHNSPHSGIGKASPLARYKGAIVGSHGLPVGELKVVSDEERLYYDFLPMELQTIQTYGVQMDYVQYSGDVLRRWVGAMDPEQPTKKRKFVFRRDPRDISAIFFFDPEARRYFRIPYSDLSHPHISLWELRAVKKYLEATNLEAIDEAAIFKAYANMQQIERAAVATTGKVRRSNAQKRALRRQESPQPRFGAAVPGHSQELVEDDASSATPVEAGGPKAMPEAERPVPRGYDEIEVF